MERVATLAMASVAGEQGEWSYGESDIEGKAARESSERVRATSEFQWSRRDASDIDGLSREAETNGSE